MAEWLKAPVLKTGIPFLRDRRFESSTLRRSMERGLYLLALFALPTFITKSGKIKLLKLPHKEALGANFPDRWLSNLLKHYPSSRNFKTSFEELKRGKNIEIMWLLFPAILINLGKIK